MTEGSSGQSPADRTPSRGDAASSGLDRVREAAQRDPSLRFTALLHHVTPSLLEDAYHALKHDAAPGVDGETWVGYGEYLEDRIADLHARVHSGRYRAKPSKRAWIPKGDGRMRPLGIAALEDKIVQQAVVWVLNAIYESDFLGFSYGFRPGRRTHDALDALWVAIAERPVNWVLDCDIRSFFDTLDHERLMEFVGYRVADRRLLRLLRKWLRAAVPLAGEWRGGRRMDADDGGDAARGGHFAASGERLPPLRPRPVGGGLAEPSGTGRCLHRPLCRRLRRGLPAP